VHTKTKIKEELVFFSFPELFYSIPCPWKWIFISCKSTKPDNSLQIQSVILIPIIFQSIFFWESNLWLSPMSHSFTCPSDGSKLRNSTVSTVFFFFYYFPLCAYVWCPAFGSGGDNPKACNACKRILWTVLFEVNNTKEDRPTPIPPNHKLSM